MHISVREHCLMRRTISGRWLICCAVWSGMLRRCICWAICSISGTNTSGTTLRKQKANSKWFSIFKIPLATYSLAGKDTAKWINRTLRNIGEEPVIYDVNQANQSQNDLLAAMHNMGYMHASVQLDTRTKGKKITATYTITPGQAYFIDNVHYIIDDDSIANLLKIEQPNSKFHIAKGTKFSVDKLDNIRKRISDYLLNSGFYRFNKDFIQFTVDSAANSQLLDVTMHLYPYRAYNDAPAVFHPRYKVGRIDYHTDNANGYLRRKIMLNNTALVQNDFFSEQKLQRTYNNFAKLGAVRYTNIQFEEVPDSQVLNTLIELTMNKPSSVSFQPEGTNTAGDLGAAVFSIFTGSWKDRTGCSILWQEYWMRRPTGRTGWDVLDISEGIICRHCQPYFFRFF